MLTKIWNECAHPAPSPKHYAVVRNSFHGGQDCVVTWADDGTSPLLNAVGPSNIALYMDSTVRRAKILPYLQSALTSARI